MHVDIQKADEKRAMLPGRTRKLYRSDASQEKLSNGDDVIILLQWWFSHSVLEESYNEFGLQKITFSKAQ